MGNIPIHTVWEASYRTQLSTKRVWWVPDRSGIFPESQQAQNSHCPGIAGFVWPHYDHAQCRVYYRGWMTYHLYSRSSLPLLLPSSLSPCPPPPVKTEINQAATANTVLPSNTHTHTYIYAHATRWQPSHFI